jgi:hypothetical protein
LLFDRVEDATHKVWEDHSIELNLVSLLLVRQGHSPIVEDLALVVGAVHKRGGGYYLGWRNQLSACELAIDQRTTVVKQHVVDGSDLLVAKSLELCLISLYQVEGPSVLRLVGKQSLYVLVDILVNRARLQLFPLFAFLILLLLLVVTYILHDLLD